MTLVRQFVKAAHSSATMDCTCMQSRLVLTPIDYRRIQQITQPGLERRVEYPVRTSICPSSCGNTVRTLNMRVRSKLNHDFFVATLLKQKLDLDDYKGLR